MSYLGITLGDVGENLNYIRIGDESMGDILTLTQDPLTSRLLTRVQDSQDSGEPWGDCLRDAQVDLA